jgi:hypothetical protein
VLTTQKWVKLLHVGGDDRRVLVWRLCEAVTGKTTPRCLKQQHQSNIFCVTFDHDNRHIITAGKYLSLHWNRGEITSGTF